MIILYIPRSLEPHRVKVLRESYGKRVTIKKAWCSQRAWMTGAHSVEANALLENVNQQLRNWEVEGLL